MTVAEGRAASVPAGTITRRLAVLSVSLQPKGSSPFPEADLGAGASAARRPAVPLGSLEGAGASSGAPPACTHCPLRNSHRPPERADAGWDPFEAISLNRPISVGAGTLVGREGTKRSTTDFRSVYATVLSRTLRAAAGAILGTTAYPPLAFV